MESTGIKHFIGQLVKQEISEVLLSYTCTHPADCSMHAFAYMPSLTACVCYLAEIKLLFCFILQDVCVRLLVGTHRNGWMRG